MCKCSKCYVIQEVVVGTKPGELGKQADVWMVVNILLAAGQLRLKHHATALCQECGAKTLSGRGELCGALRSCLINL